MRCRELDIFKILKIFENFFENFLGIFWEDLLVEINKELVFLSRFWGNAEEEGRKDKNLDP